MVTEKTYRLILCAIFIALSVAIGYAFIGIPNIEFFTATVFIAGFLLGSVNGLVIGVLAELIFSLLNPLGMAALPLLLAQVFSMGLVGWVGGRAAPVLAPPYHTFWPYVWFAFLGLILTLIFDILTTMSFAIFVSGFDMAKIASNFAYGFVFYFAHIVINTAIFAVLVPVLLQRLKPLLDSKKSSDE